MDAPEQGARAGSGARRRAEALERRVAEREREVEALRRAAETAENRRALEERRRAAERTPPRRSSWNSLPLGGALVALLRLCGGTHQPSGAPRADAPLRLEPKLPLTPLPGDALPRPDYHEQLRRDLAALASGPVAVGPLAPSARAAKRARDATPVATATGLPSATAPSADARMPVRERSQP